MRVYNIHRRLLIGLRVPRANYAKQHRPVIANNYIGDQNYFTGIWKRNSNELQKEIILHFKLIFFYNILHYNYFNLNQC